MELEPKNNALKILYIDKVILIKSWKVCFIGSVEFKPLDHSRSPCIEYFDSAIPMLWDRSEEKTEIKKHKHKNISLHFSNHINLDDTSKKPSWSRNVILC